VKWLKMILSLKRYSVKLLLSLDILLKIRKLSPTRRFLVSNLFRFQNNCSPWI
jgi:hypothetical protein